MNGEAIIAARLAAVRAHLAQEKLDGFIAPMRDEYQNEYVPPSARRIAFLTGFTGSAGLAVVLRDEAAFFTDCRYTLQARGEIPTGRFALFDSADKKPSDWLQERLQAGQRLGFDPWLHSVADQQALQKAVDKAQAALAAVEVNPIDAAWNDRPPAPCTPVVPHGIEYAGKESARKRMEAAEKLRAQGYAAFIVTDPASTAWLLNIRGGDVLNTPLPLSFSILYEDAAVEWFVDARKLTEGLAAHLGEAVRILAAQDFLDALRALGRRQARVLIDPQLCAAAIADRLRESGAALVEGEDLCALPRACKNAVEQEGMRAAHRRDGAALTRFMAWLAAQPPGTVTELQAAARLEECRAAHPLYRGPSFPTIAGSGAHGAIIHYHATPASDRLLREGELFLLDSGGQYPDGTTDVTRTIAIGTPSEEMRDRYTRVVKGHIALAMLRFPPGTTGAEIDALARQFLWAAGLDYGHGTGHGVGCYLGVHEGPQGLSRRANTVLQPGMVLSNEPGYYKEGEYGIRFENLMLVTEASIPPGGEKPMLGFEMLTLAPLDHQLLKPDMLTEAERAWIARYEERGKKAAAS